MRVKKKEFTDATVLCQTLEPPRIALYFVRKMANRCNDLLNYANIHLGQQQKNVLFSNQVSFYCSGNVIGIIVMLQNEAFIN